MAASIFNGDAIKILKNKLRFKDNTEITSTEAGYLAGVTSDIQTQLDGKASTALSNLGTTAINTNLTFDASRELNTADDATADATPTDSITITTGSKSAGTGNSGNVILETGASSGGTRGNILMNAEKVQVRGTVFGYRDIVSVDASGIIRMGQSGVSMFMNGQTVPAVDSSINLGNTALRWLNVSSDAFEGPGGTWTLQSVPSGASGVSALISSFLVDAGIATGNNSNADAVATREVYIETGNKSNASATAGTGDVMIKSGDAAGTSGNSGNLCFETGSSANGTRGSIMMNEQSLPSASVGYAWTLQSTVTGAGAWAAIPSSGNKVVASYSSTTTAAGSDEVILLSGASFTLSLPTAVGITGKVYEIVHNGTSLTQVYTIDPNGSETIRGNTTFLLHTNGQRIRIVSNGSNWVVLNHDAETEWASAGTLDIDATTTDPTKGTTQATDDVKWRRVGDSAHIRMNFRQTNATSSAAGSGDYLFNVTAIGSIDTAKVDVYATVEGWNSNFVNAFSVGRGGHGDGTTNAASAAVIPYDASYVRLASAVIGTTGGFIGSAGYPLTGTNVWYTLDFIVPIDGWEY